MNIKLFCLLFCSSFLFSFTAPISTNNASLVIVKSSESLDTYHFDLKESTIVLKSDADYKFSVNIKSKKVKGKKLLKDFSKQKRKGIQYNVIYTYEYLETGKKVTFKDKYIAWENGEIINLKPSERINIGRITLKTDIKGNN